ncbi:MAG TPA: cyanophycinase [Thermomicrobiales bacterium]
MGKQESSATPVASAPVRQLKQGPVMPIGGAEEREPGGEILERFVALSGGDQARIAVIPTASGEAQESGERYIKLFGKMGAAHADWLRVATRDDANADAPLTLLEQATGIFVTGGDQARLIELLTGTRAMDCIRERNAEGVVVAGTSAGASIVAGHALVGGSGIAPSGDAAARKGMVELSAGWGLLQDLVIDQHFSQRGRLGRLLSAFAANPGLVGIGLDEDTAALIDRDGILETLGSGMVTIVDGRSAVSDYFERQPGEVLTVARSSLHVLGPGRRFDLNSRQPLPFIKAEIEAEAAQAADA